MFIDEEKTVIICLSIKFQELSIRESQVQKNELNSRTLSKYFIEMLFLEKNQSIVRYQRELL